MHHIVNNTVVSERIDMNNAFKFTSALALAVGALVVLLLIAAQPFYIVDPGFTAIHLRFGKVLNVNSTPGWYYKMPVADNVLLINTRIRKAEIETTALSRDLQSVSIGMAINYRIDDPLKLYQTVGTDFVTVIVDPFTQESVKAVVAKFTAEDLIQSRHEAKERVITELKTRLEPRFLSLVDFNFTHLDFSPDFIKAVEEKQIAEQSAKTARNLTEKVKEEAVQTRMRADAEAYTLRIKKESVTKELIQLKQVENLIKAIEKWDGVLPRVVNGGNSLLQIPTT